MARLTESEIESAALAWQEALGYTILSGLEIAPGERAAECIGLVEMNSREIKNQTAGN